MNKKKTPESIFILLILEFPLLRNDIFHFITSLYYIPEKLPQIP